MEPWSWGLRSLSRGPLDGSHCRHVGGRANFGNSGCSYDMVCSALLGCNKLGRTTLAFCYVMLCLGMECYSSSWYVWQFAPGSSFFDTDLSFGLPLPSSSLFCTDLSILLAVQRICVRFFTDCRHFVLISCFGWICSATGLFCLDGAMPC